MAGFDEPTKVFDLMRYLPCRWGIAGGWALDLFLNRVTREHQDIEVAIFRADQLVLQSYLSRQYWSLEYVRDSRLYPWPLGERLELPVHEIWGRKTDEPSRRLEVLLNERIDDDFIFRRDARIRMPVEEAFITSASGIPILPPEIVLLYKSKRGSDEKEKIDFSNTLQFLDSRRRSWLSQSIGTIDAEHPWLMERSSSD